MHSPITYAGIGWARRPGLAHRGGLPAALPRRRAGGLALPPADGRPAGGPGLLRRTQRRIDFAADSRLGNAWTAEVYRRARARGKRHPHAVRSLARAWLGAIWRCWQDHSAYDPARHQALQRHPLEPAA
jgi:hypothetical protein